VISAAGALVGTFQYMSPEQLEGEEADARSDIFGLGCVLFEMVAGRRAFEGKSTAKVVAAIMTTEPPPLTTLSPLTPAPLERAVKKCLAKDPEERWQSAGDLSSELRWISESGSQSGVVIAAPVRSQRKRLRWVALALIAAAGILAGFLLRRPTVQATLRLAVNLPPSGSLAQNQTAVLSPDGQMVVMSLVDAEGKGRLWIRRLSSDTAQPMLDTDGAINPFWSPDSQICGFLCYRRKSEEDFGHGRRSLRGCDCDVVERVRGAPGTDQGRSSSHRGTSGFTRFRLRVEPQSRFP